MKTLTRIQLVAVLVLLGVQGCSTPTYTRAPRPIIDKGSQAPVISDRSAPVVPPRVQVIPPREQVESPVVVRQPPAVVALLEHAEQQANAGDLGSAAASLERAIRINPGDPVLWHHLAKVRLEQGDAVQAEQLAVKSNSLAPGNSLQQARNWTLIADARRAQGDVKGAAAAEQQARELARR